ncbi:MAG TPA: hypothetical protein VFY26_15505 [Anaerolineales bacterium]|nr:hypothetical protein [Anaerolineales bacterium]
MEIHQRFYGVGVRVGVSVRVGVDVRVEVGVRLGVRVCVGVTVEVSVGRGVGVKDGVQVGGGGWVGVFVQVGMGVRDAVGVEERKAINVLRRSVWIADVASRLVSVVALGDGVIEAVGDGPDVELAVTERIRVSVKICGAGSDGVRVVPGVCVDREVGLAVGEKICPATGSPQKAAAPLNEASTSATVSHCQPASIRACRVL